MAAVYLPVGTLESRLKDRDIEGQGGCGRMQQQIAKVEIATVVPN